MGAVTAALCDRHILISILAGVDAQDIFALQRVRRFWRDMIHTSEDLHRICCLPTPSSSGPSQSTHPLLPRLFDHLRAIELGIPSASLNAWTASNATWRNISLFWPPSSEATILLDHRPGCEQGHEMLELGQQYAHAAPITLGLLADFLQKPYSGPKESVELLGVKAARDLQTGECAEWTWLEVGPMYAGRRSLEQFVEDYERKARMNREWAAARSEGREEEWRERYRQECEARREEMLRKQHQY